MGLLSDPKLKELHDKIQVSLQWNSPPDWQAACVVLNGMSMPDMLDELWRIKGSARLTGLSLFAPKAAGVNVPRLRAAIGAMMDQPPADLDSLLQTLPEDQQFCITSVRAKTQAPDSLAPTLWPKYYWSTRSIAPPSVGELTATADASSGGGGTKADDDDWHVGADIATGLTANAPRSKNPITYTATVVFRDLDALKLGKGDTELALLHEPNVGVQLSPDPNNPATYQAAISLVNLHLKRNWGLWKPDVEFSLGGQVGVNSPSNTLTGAVQAQLEVHVTTQISVTAMTGLNFGPGLKPGDPPDRGAIHFGNRDVDVGFTPFMIGIIGHWDPP
ncbi:MAG TPA: hypothetical protein VKV39_19370 [Candidatus Sulfotelmatobacter sp.]|nr:hypothetical protein [Candidatus Sulfotelmatobacter sp.]